MIQEQERTPDRSERIDQLARTPRLFVALDYDGTIAPIVADPSAAMPDRNAVVALRSLAELAHTQVAVISGRCLSDLANFVTGIDGLHLIGSHGSEFDAGFTDSLPENKRDLLRRIRAELRKIAASAPGITTEEKPASVCLHVRNAKEQDAEAAVRAVEEGPARLPGVSIKRGKKVIELCVIETDKGKALTHMRKRYSATMCVFIGDDVTDEDAFRSLHGPDLGIKVGPGETAAKMRLEDPGDVARFLASLAEAREAWLSGGAGVPIEQHSMLTDQRSIALLTPGARITWLCAPRIDAPSIFADLLGGTTAGHWTISPEDGSNPTGQAYVGDTMTVRTEWDGLSVTDYLDCSGERTRHHAGRLDLVRVVEGSGTVRIEFAPRLNFGQIATRLQERGDGLVVSGSHDFVVLRAPGVEWEIVEEGVHHTARGTGRLDGKPLTLELRYGSQNLAPGWQDEPMRRDQTGQYWSNWAQTLIVPEKYQHAVRRSALILRGLCYGPTGAIAAAGTTSLPERIGGVRNWDYRYCWPRDAAMAALALVRLGSLSEAFHFLEWLKGVVGTLPTVEALAPLYTVTGEQLGPEAEISDLAGYAGSRPVRIGNAAAYQVQLDVFGPIVQLVAELARRGAPLSGWHWQLVDSLAKAVSHRWSDPDHGIWEPRIPPRHHVHSKVMCWLTLASSNEVARAMLAEPPGEYNRLMDTIRDEVFEKGWSESVGAFTDAYGNDALDAATLLIGLCGMLEPSDPRFISTVDAVNKHLRNGSTVYRYFHDDGLPGDEGGFHLCTTWLIESLAAIGRRAEAVELFDRYLSMTGATGLMSEEYDPDTGLSLGNVPQAYSHLGLINAALSLSG